MRHRIRATVALLAGAAFVAAFPCAADEAKVIEDNWHALYLGEQKAGYQHEVVSEEPGPDGPTYRTVTHVELALARVDVAMRFVIDTEISEGQDGRVGAFSQTVNGPLAMSTKGRVEGDELVVTSRAGAASQTTRVPAHDGLGPRALLRLRDEKGYAAGTTYSVNAFVPDAPMTATGMTVSVAAPEDVDLYGVTKRLHRADTRIARLPGVAASEWFDDAGTVWLARTVMGGFVLEARRTTRALATSPDEPTDILSLSFLRTDRPIPSPRRLARLRLLLVPLGGEAGPLTLESDPFQQVERTDRGLVVTLTRAEGHPELSYKLPYAGTKYADLMTPNVWLETRAPLIVKMSREAVGGETDALAAARRIERYVSRVITAKNLSLGFATAAEAAAQRAGDCTEHAVLLAALARAAGMPARVVGGIVYVDSLPGVRGGGFGYHMWTEVFVGEWLPFDATLGGHDATHLALVRSDLNDPDALFDLSAAISGFFGRAAVKVLEVGESAEVSP